jgi:hypothetical protein
MSGAAIPPSGDVALAAILRGFGIVCAVEARGRLALLRSTDAGALADMELRRRVDAAASECGFTHVALELVGTGADAAIRGA